MANNYGKKFESKFKEDFRKIPGADLTRLYDTTNGFKSISNVSDFIGYMYPFIYYLEIKSTQGNTFALSKLTQADKLKEKQGILGVNAGVVIWFIDHKRVCYVPIEEYCRLEDNGYKSVNIKMVGDPLFKVYEIPGILKRTFIDSDYTVLKDIAYEKYISMINK